MAYHQNFKSEYSRIIIYNFSQSTHVYHKNSFNHRLRGQIKMNLVDDSSRNDILRKKEEFFWKYSSTTRFIQPTSAFEFLLFVFSPRHSSNLFLHAIALRNLSKINKISIKLANQHTHIYIYVSSINRKDFEACYYYGNSSRSTSGIVCT